MRQESTWKIHGAEKYTSLKIKINADRYQGGKTMATRTITFRDAVNEAMRLEMRRDPTVILFGEDVAGGATLAHMEGENKEAWGGAVQNRQNGRSARS